MKLGKFCEKHQEFSPDGECRWCEPPPSEVPKRSFAEAARKMIQSRIEAATEWAATAMPPLQQQGGPLPAWPLPNPNIGPLPVASCKHDGVLYDYGGTTSCAACGKILTSPVKPPCEMLQTTHTMATCGAASAWRWVAESGAALAAPKKEYFFCDFHGKNPVGGWRADPTT